ncbi:MAG: bestrophin family ion channel, partial [bacterium]
MNPRAGWWSVVFTLRGSTLPRIWQRVALAALVALLVTFSERLFGVQPLRLTSTPFSLIGVALGIFLGFRNNASYDRFWEARKLWGALVNTSRSFTRQAQTLILAPEGADEREMAAVEALQRALIHRQIAYVHALRLHLRRATDWRELREFIDAQELADLEGESNRPAALTHRTGAL